MQNSVSREVFLSFVKNPNDSCAPFIPIMIIHLFLSTYYTSLMCCKELDMTEVA